MFIVTRNCCTSGNCDTCTHRTPYGRPVRVDQLATPDRARAETVARNWSSYAARVEERPDQEAPV